MAGWRGFLRGSCDRQMIVCLQDYNKGVLADLFCKKVIRLAAKAHKKVLVDPSPISDYSKYAGASLITPNQV